MRQLDQVTLDALRAAPGMIVEAQESGELANAVHAAVRTLAQEHRGFAVFLVPFGPGLGPTREPARGLVIDEPAHEVQLDGQVVHLTYKEFALLRFLFAHRDRAFSRDALLETLWGLSYSGGRRTVDIHVRRLRRKLGDDVLDTVRGVGYRFGRDVRVRTSIL